MKKSLLMAILLSLSPGLGSAQTMDELLNDGKNTDNVLTLSMGFARQNYSPLNQINKGNVKRLVPVWSRNFRRGSACERSVSRPGSRFAYCWGS